jgi:pimeloyl-ACP methyl ester carboxylesterase
MTGRRLRAPSLAPASVLSLAALVVPVSMGVSMLVSSLRTLRRLRNLPVEEPELPGYRRIVVDGDDEVTFRFHEGIDPSLVPLVFVHGWGQCADASWFSVLPKVPNPFIAVDLPGHGSSATEAFDFDRAARAVLIACDAVGFSSPHLVAHSMGGPVALSTIRLAPGRFSGFTAIATAIAWHPPRLSLPLRLFPLIAGRGSPLTLRRMRRQLRQVPAYTEALVWAWRNPPSAKVLASSASALRGFDARGWALELPPTRFVVPEEDNLVRPRVQRQHARLLGAEVVEVPEAGHSFFLGDPDALVVHLPR